MKQTPLKNYLKLGSLLFGIFLVLLACQEETFDNPLEEAQEKRLKRISLNELNARIGSSRDYSKLSALFDVNQSKKTNYQQRLEASDNPYLLTDEIVVIQKENITFYTFTIESDATGHEFYNLVVAMDQSNTIRSTRILEYIPSEYWLQDTSQPFNGDVKIHDNNIFSVTDINNMLSAREDQCVVDVTTEWECNHGNDHAPGTCTAGGSDLIVTIHWGPCPEEFDAADSSGGGGGFPVGDGNTGGGGGTTGGSSGNSNNDANPPDDNENCVLDSNGHCLTDDTTALPPREAGEENDCLKIKNDISDIPLIKSRLHTMKVEGGNFEKGLRVDINPNTGAYTPTDILNDNNGPAHINIPLNPYTVVVAHTHPPSEDDYYAMFSGADIIKIGQNIKYVQSVNVYNPVVDPIEITHIVIADGRTFAIRFDEAASVQTLLHIYEDKKKKDDFIKKLHDAYKSDHDGYPTYNSTTTIAKQQQHLYNLFSKNNLNMSLYEANYDANGFINDWQKINKETLEKEPCN